MDRRRIVMIYPQQGFSGSYVKHMPLSLLYASAAVIKAGYEVRILDTRIDTDWRRTLARLLTEAPTLCVGISVMSGRPITNAIAIGRAVKALDAELPVVWGGPHATFYPEGILADEWSCDYVLSGYASKSFHALADCLRRRTPVDLVPGLSWREDGAIRRGTAEDKSFENIPWRDIPYHLIGDHSVYGQVDQDRMIFSMYSALGCPYQCSFCSSPAQYAPIKGRKWIPLEAKDVVDHVQYVAETYGANYIYFIDDDSFPKLDHVRAVVEGIRERGLPVKLGFRGARINEIKRMDDAFLSMLVAAGTDIMHIGAESGSDRILKLIRKDCTAQDIVEINRKLARHPEITAAYNFLMGVPTETLEELKQTRDLMLRLVEDHPNCLVFPPNKFRPLPGTELYDVAARKWNYKMPKTLKEWADIEVEGGANKDWYAPGMEKFFNLMLVCSYFIDNKIMKVSRGRTWFFKFARLLNFLYRPIALFRLKHGITFALVEYWGYRVFTRLMSRSEKTA